MSNQPKITYRSDSTGYNYHMQLKNRHFTVVAIAMIEDYHSKQFTSQSYECKFPWRNSINLFFDIVDHHINTGKWMFQDEAKGK